MSALRYAFGAGALFGVGLAVAGMTQPAKVMNFLDVTGAWDPSLAFVMGGALAVHALLSRLVLRRASPVFDTHFHLPARKDIDLPLLVGAALFGVGWGLGGYCPGPSLVSLGAADHDAALFFLAMAAGTWLAQLGANTRSRAVAPADESA